MHIQFDGTITDTDAALRALQEAGFNAPRIHLLQWQEYRVPDLPPAVMGARVTVELPNVEDLTHPQSILLADVIKPLLHPYPPIWLLEPTEPPAKGA